MDIQDIIMDPSEGEISFRGNRLLLFHADALSQLKDELIKTLGLDLARGVLVRLGYRCGYSDAQSAKSLFNLENDSDWMLAGPKIHTREGLVHVTNQVLEYDREANHFYMCGKWENSFEAKQYIKTYGHSAEAVCWTNVGYASGYSSSFFGQEAVCVETKCIAKGDPYCQYEIRAKSEWEGKADQNCSDLQANTVVKSLQLMLREGKEWVSQWKLLNEIALQLSNGLNFNELDIAFYQEVCQFVSCEKVYLIIKKPNSKGCNVFAYVLGANRVVAKQIEGITGSLANLLENGTEIMANGEDLPKDFKFVGKIMDFIAVPLVSNGCQSGSLLVANKLTSHGFNEYDKNILALLGIQLAMVIENTKLYHITDQELQITNAELKRVNEFLLVQQQSLQKSIDLHNQFIGLVLENSGLQKIVSTIGQAIGLPVWIEDREFRVLAKTRVADKSQQISSREFFSKSFDKGLDKGLIESFYSRGVTAVFQMVGKTEQPIRRCLTPIIAGKEILGFLTVDLNQRRLLEGQELILRDASVVIALVLLKQMVLVDSKKQLVKNLLDDWLFSNILKEEQVLEWTMKLGITLDYPLSLIVLEFEGGKIGPINKCVNELRNFMPPNGFIGIHENNLVIILSNGGDGQAGKLKDLLIMLLGQSSALKWWLTMGAKSNSIFETRQNYLNACAANQIMKHLNKENTCFDYEDLGAYGMLGIEPKRFVWFARKVLGEVIDYDKKHNTELISTLKLYFKSNQNIQAASRQGFVNDGTLKYRLKRIQEIAGLDLTNPEVTLQVQLALKFL
ncbi:MAG: hypothetical protein APF81_18105 [Desulfosporosinus sp. BRH_c37]|nr:MAG: hypothetical protein APF81_18105 [Desulfosporosinus sp. BRH_c37]